MIPTYYSKELGISNPLSWKGGDGLCIPEGKWVSGDDGAGGEGLPLKPPLPPLATQTKKTLRILSSKQDSEHPPGTRKLTLPSVNGVAIKAGPEVQFSIELYGAGGRKKAADSGGGGGPIGRGRDVLMSIASLPNAVDTATAPIVAPAVAPPAAPPAEPPAEPAVKPSASTTVVPILAASVRKRAASKPVAASTSSSSTCSTVSSTSTPSNRWNKRRVRRGRMQMMGAKGKSRVFGPQEGRARGPGGGGEVESPCPSSIAWCKMEVCKDELRETVEVALNSETEAMVDRCLKSLRRRRAASTHAHSHSKRRQKTKIDGAGGGQNCQKMERRGGLGQLLTGVARAVFCGCYRGKGPRASGLKGSPKGQLPPCNPFATTRKLDSRPCGKR